MRIALLNLPFDNNYGGNLQRYALITVLKRQGYDIEHINVQLSYHLPWYKYPFSYTKRFLKKMLGIDKRPICLEQYLCKEDTIKNQKAKEFYNKYIPHTHVVTRKKDLYNFHYDAYIVGSDQVWRKNMTSLLGLESYFLDFIEDKKIIKIAYGVSLGNEFNELTRREIKSLKYFYEQFDSVSVREDSALQLFDTYQWVSPQAIQVLDPTLLLTKEDYVNLINAKNTEPSSGDLFCYILDYNENKQQIICDIAEKKNLTPFIVTLDDGNVSIEQWLRSFQDATYIVTDSYHGLVFSIIFNKPFTLIQNKKRGNSRFDSLLKMLDITVGSFDWYKINSIISNKKEVAINFLNEALNNRK